MQHVRKISFKFQIGCILTGCKLNLDYIAELQTKIHCNYSHLLCITVLFIKLMTQSSHCVCVLLFFILQKTGELPMLTADLERD